MKKVLVSGLIVLIVCIVSALSFGACGKIELTEMDGTEYYTSIEKGRSVELVDQYFEDILKDPDFVITCKNKEGEVQYTETVKGSDSYTFYPDGSQVYAFKKGGYFYAAFISKQADGQEPDRAYYCSDSTKKGYFAGDASGTMEEMYKKNYCKFMNDESGTAIVDQLPEEGGEFHCTTRVERISGIATSTLEFTYESANRTVCLSASADEKKVEALHVEINDTSEGGRSSDLTWTFVYGGATVTLPDVDAWDK